MPSSFSSTKRVLSVPERPDSVMRAGTLRWGCVVESTITLLALISTPVPEMSVSATEGSMILPVKLILPWSVCITLFSILLF